MQVDDFAQSAHNAPPMRLGQRYDATGFLPDPGNTVVCHLDRDAPGGKAVLAARAAMQALPGADRLLFTPEDSLHMTVFEGVLDNRRVPDAWPDWMPADAPVDAVTDAMCERLGGFAGPGAFAVSVAALRPTGLALRGAAAGDAAVLRAWRDALAETFGYRQAVHDRYEFHMTFAYPLAWLPDDHVPLWREELARIGAELAAATAVIPLGAPAFCRFADMTRFEELVVLG